MCVSCVKINSLSEKILSDGKRKKQILSDCEK